MLHKLYDGAGNVARWFWYDDSDGRFGWRANQDATDVVERVREQREIVKRPDPKRWQMPVCEIPTDMFDQWLEQNGFTLHQYNSDPDVKAKLIAHTRTHWPHLMVSNR